MPGIFLCVWLFRLGFCGDYTIYLSISLENNNRKEQNMYYLKLFENHSQYGEYAGGDMLKPNVSHCVEENEVHYNQRTWADEYFTTVARENGTISFNIWQSMGTDMIKSISYSSEEIPIFPNPEP